MTPKVRATGNTRRQLTRSSVTLEQDVTTKQSAQSETASRKDESMSERINYDYFAIATDLVSLMTVIFTCPG